jgi:hypothetical protein
MNISRTRWRLLSLLAALSLCAVLVQAATASPGQGAQSTDVSLAPALAVMTAGAQESIQVTSSTALAKTTSTTFLDVPRTLILLPIPSGHRDLLVLRFSGESVCWGGGIGVDGRCSLRILVDNTEANPAVGSEFSFDSTNLGRETAGSHESQAIERSLCVGPGTHTVRVQFKTNRSDVAFQLDDYHFSVQRSHGC